MLKVALVGILGFGKVHLSSIRACEQKGICSLDALVISDLKNSRLEMENLLTEKPGLRVYTSLESLVEQKDTVDLVCLPTGIGSHKALSLLALNAGYHVLCEKPAAGNYEDAFAMAEAQKRSGKILAIGYQNLFSPSIQRLKHKVLSGRLGRLKEARTIVGWPRHEGYYTRNSWAGEIFDNQQFVFDSPLQNAAAHFLQNMLYIAGNTLTGCCTVDKVYGENYHANPILSADTQFLRVLTTGGAVLNMAASHAIDCDIEPLTEFFFEKGRITWSNQKGLTVLKDTDGTVCEQWDNGDVDPLVETFENTMVSIMDNKRPFSDIHNALTHSACLDALYHCMNPVRKIDPSCCKIKKSFGPEGEDLWYIMDLDKALSQSFETGMSFFEMNLPWSSRGEILRVGR